jgi:hypothetical protein
MKSVFKAVENFFKNLFTSKSWQQQFTTTITVLATEAEGILEFTGEGDDVAVTTTVVQEITSALSTISALVQSYQSAPATASARIKAELSAITSNLSSLLAEGHVKNTATVAKVNEFMGLVNTDAPLLLGLLPASTSTGSATT